MIIEKALQDAVTGNAPLAALVGSRVYLTWAAPSATLPYIVINEISSPENEFVPVASARIQFSVFSSKIDVGKDIVQKLNKLLKGYSGTLGGFPVHWIRLDNVNHFFEQGERLHHHAVDYIVKYTRS